MATDTPGPAPGRPRPWLLVALALAVAAFVATRMFSGGGGPASVTTSGARAPAAAGQEGPIDPAQLDVRIESLGKGAPGLADVERNPFRFQAKPQPPPPEPSGPVGPPRPAPAGPDPTASAPAPPPPPSGPPPIGEAIKFIGVIETTSGKIGAFSDCRATFPGREGEVIEGRYRVVRIGIESAVLEYADGRGRTTLPLNGQACVTR